VLSGAIQNYAEHYSKTGDFETHAFLYAVKDFFFVFCFSLVIGTVMGKSSKFLNLELFKKNSLSF
jgi:sodium/hydrogen exchanger-like protein 6/7